MKYMPVRISKHYSSNAIKSLLFAQSFTTYMAAIVCVQRQISVIPLFYIPFPIKAPSIIGCIISHWGRQRQYLFILQYWKRIGLSYKRKPPFSARITKKIVHNFRKQRTLICQGIFLLDISGAIFVTRLACFLSQFLSFFLTFSLTKFGCCRESNYCFIERTVCVVRLSRDSLPSP